MITYERSTLVNREKYIGLDVHQATISVAVMDSRGKVVMESILETKAATILEFFAGLRGTLLVTFEEGAWALAVRSAEGVCVQVSGVQPAQEALLKHGNKSDRVEAASWLSCYAWGAGARVPWRDKHAYAARAGPKLL
jgi:hypothetical protein